MAIPLMKLYQLTCILTYFYGRWGEKRGAVVALEWDLRIVHNAGNDSNVEWEAQFRDTGLRNSRDFLWSGQVGGKWLVKLHMQQYLLNKYA